MSAFDFRAWLDKQDKSDKLLRVPVEIDTLDDMGAFISRADYKGINTPILFENPKGFDIPILTNTVGHLASSIGDGHGVGSEGDGILPNIANKMMSILKSGGVPPVYVDKSKAACKEIILTGKDVDLTRLPIPRCNPLDGIGSPNFLEGRFVTNLAVTKPTPTSHNLSYHRFEVTRKDGGSIWIYRGTGDAKSMEKAWDARMDDPEETYDPEKGKPFPMAFVFGVTPEFLLAGANKALPHEGDDYAFIGGLRNEAVEMVRCETIDVDVPAHAEIVIEGVFQPFNWTTQGAFASFNGSYDEPRRRPIFDVTAITMRKNPIYQHVHIGRPLNETNSLAGFFRGVHVYNEVKAVLPNLVDVYMDPSAGIGFTIHLSIKKGRIGEPKLAMMRAYTALQGFCKHVFVYDDDVDISDPHERNWALAHRFIPDRDLLIIPNVLGMNLEPMAQGVMGSNSKLGLYDGYPELPLNVRTFMGVDCTVPIGLKNKVMKRVRPSPEVEARVDKLWESTFSRK
ncbi:MAG: UbiD family decarboxylase [Pseudomonadales bacterium]|nr:UbiD family decarboxylase [Pseudomonadales bacterium]